MTGVKVHLIDGTYELFRQHYGQVARHDDPGPTAAAAGVVASTLELVAQGATHVGVASDHVIESFRNDLWRGYKTSAGMEPALLAQIPVMEGLLEACGFTTWAMVEHEADDALGAAAAVAAADDRVEQVLIVTPDKDLGQCVRGTRVVQYDRRKREIIDEDGGARQVRRRPGVDRRLPRASSATAPTAIPASPAGERRAPRQCWPSSGTIEAIPLSSGEWRLGGLRGVEKLSKALRDNFADALLFKRIATSSSTCRWGRSTTGRGTARPSGSRRRRRWPACPSWSSGRSTPYGAGNVQ